MMKTPPSTKYAFGRQKRFRDGPLPVTRTAHPTTLEHLQIPSEAHKVNLLQYIFSPGVATVSTDRQLPKWVMAFVPNGRSAGVQLVSFDDGSQLIVRIRGSLISRCSYMEQLKPNLWIYERAKDDINRNLILNSNLLWLAGLLIASSAGLSEEKIAAVHEAFSNCNEVLRGELLTYLVIRHGAFDIDVLDAILVNLFIARKIYIHIEEREWSLSTRISTSALCFGPFAPVPGPMAVREAL